MNKNVGLDSTDYDKIYLNGVELDELYLDGVLRYKKETSDLVCSSNLSGSTTLVSGSKHITTLNYTTTLPFKIKYVVKSTTGETSWNFNIAAGSGKVWTHEFTPSTNVTKIYIIVTQGDATFRFEQTLTVLANVPISYNSTNMGPEEIFYERTGDGSEDLFMNYNCRGSHRVRWFIDGVAVYDVTSNPGNAGYRITTKHEFPGDAIKRNYKLLIESSSDTLMRQGSMIVYPESSFANALPNYTKLYLGEAHNFSIKILNPREGVMLQLKRKIGTAAWETIEVQRHDKQDGEKECFFSVTPDTIGTHLYKVSLYSSGGYPRNESNVVTWNVFNKITVGGTLQYSNMSEYDSDTMMARFTFTPTITFTGHPDASGGASLPIIDGKFITFEQNYAFVAGRRTTIGVLVKKGTSKTITLSIMAENNPSDPNNDYTGTFSVTKSVSPPLNSMSITAGYSHGQGDDEFTFTTNINCNIPGTKSYRWTIKRVSTNTLISSGNTQYAKAPADGGEYLFTITMTVVDNFGKQYTDTATTRRSVINYPYFTVLGVGSSGGLERRVRIEAQARFVNATVKFETTSPSIDKTYTGVNLSKGANMLVLVNGDSPYDWRVTVTQGGQSYTMSGHKTDPRPTAKLKKASSGGSSSRPTRYLEFYVTNSWKNAQIKMYVNGTVIKNLSGDYKNGDVLAATSSGGSGWGFSYKLEVTSAYGNLVMTGNS